MAQQQAASPGSLRVATFNIAHGRGVAASNWQAGTDQERIARLDEIASLLRRIDADIVVLNEVDFDCSWSSHTNQARYLARKAGYRYRAEQRNLDFRVLFWTWRFGNAVLSKYPITDAQIVDLPGYSRLETLLAGKKRALSCEVAAEGGVVRVVGAHLSHRSESLRVKSSGVIVELVKKAKSPTVVAGDLNSTPPDFPEALTDENGQNAIATLDSCGYFRREPNRPGNEDRNLTFHAAEPTLAIDWILIPANWEYRSYTVDPAVLSDHRLVFADLSAPSE